MCEHQALDSSCPLIIWREYSQPTLVTIRLLLKANSVSSKRTHCQAVAFLQDDAEVKTSALLC